MTTDKQVEISVEDLLNHTATIVAAHVSHNAVAPGDVPDLIRSVHSTLSGFDKQEDQAPELVPAVPIKKSIRPDYIVCLEDGKKLKMLKRHLKTSYNMTPEEYRAKWNLPVDYPMVAPNYAAQRSELARQIGLGQINRSKGTTARKSRSRAAA